MNTDRKALKHQDLTEKIIGVFYGVYNELGPGFLESVYVEALAVAFREKGLAVERELPLSVHFRDHIVGQFRADLVVGGAILVETKACACLQATHEAQVLNYLRATVLEVGLLINFGPKPTVKRYLFDNACKTASRTAARDVDKRTTYPEGAIRSHLC
jgi:GxxExxY protein